MRYIDFKNRRYIKNVGFFYLVLNFSFCNFEINFFLRNLYLFKLILNIFVNFDF